MVEGVLPSLSVRERTRRIEPGLLAWRKGQRQYYTVFFVRRDSGIEDLDELVGKTLAFESQRSTSAYFIPRATLIARGLPLASGPGVEGPEDTVSYVFAGSELNQIYWVQRGQVDAAAFNDGDWDRVPPGIKNELRIIHRSEPILRWLVSFDRDLDPRLRHEVSEALLEAAQDETGRAALQAASRIARFETLTADDRANLAHWAAILRSLP
jgi:phosphonate transport system substrate-binding protein